MNNIKKLSKLYFIFYMSKHYKYFIGENKFFSLEEQINNHLNNIDNGLYNAFQYLLDYCSDKSGETITEQAYKEATRFMIREAGWQFIDEENEIPKLLDGLKALLREPEPIKELNDYLSML